jgi:hypothetical protein
MELAASCLPKDICCRSYLVLDDVAAFPAKLTGFLAVAMVAAVKALALRARCNTPSFHHCHYCVTYSSSSCKWQWIIGDGTWFSLNSNPNPLFNCFQNKCKESLYGNFRFSHTTMPI